MTALLQTVTNPQIGDDADDAKEHPWHFHDLTGSIRNHHSLERSLHRSGQSHLRNSLIAVDTQTGEVVGVLAHGVLLADDGTDDSSSCRTSPDKLNREEKRHNTILIQRAAQTYHDPDVRPSSRQGSILREDTFAPPPVPEKTNHLGQHSYIHEFENENYNTKRAESAASDSDGDVTDGFVRTHAKHVEAHRPDLLLDPSCDSKSDASGSTIGGPIVQLWNKARGAKRQTKTPENPCDIPELPDKLPDKLPDNLSQGVDGVKESVEPSVERKDDVPETEETQVVPDHVSHHMTQSHSPPNHTQSPLPKIALPHSYHNQIAPSEVQRMEDDIWKDALENGSLPIDAPYTHLPALMEYSNTMKGYEKERILRDGLNEHTQIANTSKKDAKVGLQAPMQGSSVLLDFLAGSRIIASVIHGAPSRQSGEARVDPHSAHPQTSWLSIYDAWNFMPILPSHILWFFGFTSQDSSVKNGKIPEHSSSSEAELTTTVGHDLAAMINGHSATTILQTASERTGKFWDSIYDLSNWVISKTKMDWHGSSLKEKRKASISYPFPDEEEHARSLDVSEPGEEDAFEWEWHDSTSDDHGIENTPRPQYRRKRLVPSTSNGFRVPHIMSRDTLDRYSILHFDHEGYGRHAFIRGHDI